MIRQIEQAAGLERDDAPEARLDKVETLLARAVPDPREAASLLAARFGLDESARYPALDLTPQQQKARTLQVLIDQLEGLARRRPVLVVLEDLHWVDPTTRELFDLVIDRLQHLPVLLIVTFRPELEPPWTGFPHVTLLTLDRLARTKPPVGRYRNYGRVLPATRGRDHSGANRGRTPVR